MTNASETRAPPGTLRALLSILLAIAVLVAAQTLALLLGEILLGAGVPGPACNVLPAVLYVLFALGGAALLCRVVLHLPLAAAGSGFARSGPLLPLRCRRSCSPARSWPAGAGRSNALTRRPCGSR